MDLEHNHRTEWFLSEVHAHHRPLRNYLAGAFPWLEDVDDVVQDALLRVWQVRDRAAVRCGRALLFSTARNCALDLRRRQQACPCERTGDFDALEVQEGGPNAAESACRSQEFELLKEALKSLPPRCREIVVLRKLYNFSQRDIAERLGLSEHTVETQVSRGIRRCTEFLRRRGLKSAHDENA